MQQNPEVPSVEARLPRKIIRSLGWSRRLQASLPPVCGQVASCEATTTSLDPPQRAISESLVRQFSPGFVAGRRGRGPEWANFSQTEGWNEVAGLRTGLDAKELGPQIALLTLTTRPTTGRATSIYRAASLPRCFLSCSTTPSRSG